MCSSLGSRRLLLLLLLLLLHRSCARLLVKTRQDNWHSLAHDAMLYCHPVPCVRCGEALTALCTPHRDVMSDVINIGSQFSWYLGAS
jgi:hypothetical protein